MKNLIRAESLKLRTTRVFWVYVAVALAFVPVSVALAMTTGQEAAPLDSSEGLRNVISAASSGGLLVLLVGIALMAGEFRHNTATTTFLISPDRRRVVAAKLAAGSVVGIGVAVLASLLTLAVALPWLAARNVEVSLLSSDVGVPLLGALLSTALAAVVGIGLGAIMPNQTLAITVVVVWTSVVDAILIGFVPEIGRWLPGGAASSLAGTATPEGGLLPIWGAALLLAGYGLAFTAAGTRLVVRRAIT
jgi:ABC-type transport system involved in multi-copper enzyme maturation permease subunit